MAQTQPGASILVVDDNLTSRLKMSMAVKQLGHMTDAAQDGREALTLLNDGLFDLVLLDIEMPVLDGYGVLEAMKADPALRDIPVIVISAVEDMEAIVKGIELGAQDFLPKDFDRVLFAARVGACLAQKQLRDQEATYLDQIETERRRADDLLHATLPARAVSELKATNEVKPRRYEDVVVMMVDVVNFTDYCDKNPPELAVRHLQNLVSRFEDITFSHGLEKIKTTGDAYMATADLLLPHADAALATAACALDMRRVAASVTNGWQVRVGFHIGPVVAGVIGQHQHLFDLWGDTVNTAARITSMASPDTIYASADIWSRLAGRCTGQSKGALPAKGKGALDVFQIDGLVG